MNKELEEPKYAGWYCQKCPTVIYMASEKDIAKHRCFKQKNSETCPTCGQRKRIGH